MHSTNHKFESRIIVDRIIQATNIKVIGKSNSLGDVYSNREAKYLTKLFLNMSCGLVSIVRNGMTVTRVNNSDKLLVIIKNIRNTSCNRRRLVIFCHNRTTKYKVRLESVKRNGDLKVNMEEKGGFLEISLQPVRKIQFDQGHS